MSRRPGDKGAPPKKQQAASLARRMAGKKGQTTQLQVEVNNEEDWEKLLAREGLIVMDVYSEWSGPCVGMIGNLKKAKVEFGGEALHLAIVKSDEIEVLARFRNRSEPTWLFAAGGMLATIAFGANAPKLMKMIETEVNRELKSLKGETWRRGGPFDELCEEEKERLEAAAKMKSEAERLEAERKAREAEEKRLNTYNQMAEHLLYETVVICFPHTIDPEFGCVLSTELDLFWRGQMMYIATQLKMSISKETIEEIFLCESMELSEDFLEDMASGPCLVQLVKCQIIAAPGQEGEKFLGDIETQVCEALNGVKLTKGQELVVPASNCIPSRYPYVKRTKAEPTDEEEEEEIIEEVTSVPGCWTPASYISKCAAVRFLFPGRAEKVMIPEEPPIPPKVVVVFEPMKQKECFELAEEYEDDVLNFGYFSGTDPDTAEPLCATPEQYAKLQHSETDKLVFVVKKTKSEPLLSFAGLGAVYVSLDEKNGVTEADKFFPPGVELKFRRLEEAELAQKQAAPEEAPEEEAPEEEEEEEEPVIEDENDLMALLGVTVE